VCEPICDRHCWGGMHGSWLDCSLLYFSFSFSFSSDGVMFEPYENGLRIYWTCGGDIYAGEGSGYDLKEWMGDRVAVWSVK
jgi:hypothetical protein